MRRRIILAGLAAAPLAAPVSRSARAQGAFPDHPLNMVLAFPAGGGTDVAARPLAKIMEKYLGQPIVVTNRPGAAGEIGFTELARSKPDGYTIGFINTPTIVTIPIERPQARFRLDDFAPVLNIVDDPGAVWVLPDSPIKTVADLVAEAKKRPGQISYGTSGIGSDDHLAMLALERVADIKLLHVPFAGGAPVRTATLSKQIELAVTNMGEAYGDYRQGMFRPIGQMGPSRWQVMPDVPTFREQGFDVVEGSMRGLAAPAGLPRPVLEKLVNAARQAAQDPEWQAVATQLALPLRLLGPDEYRAELVAMKSHYEKLWHQHPWRD
ncbi:tripartite tricarboxylate transporter substrate binding protein [Siccirubricoccus sp. KC 17139]|uniref:Tripartite tricarboxylate transporter substrate binding protein n=1 Tax=Siccirubricoccus soli TaxID=2899147 RepID=A0ABT1D3J8_9PROT|nr:tripartite tricarboxylate transporter substrate binding protein [Siccirubricoccus soli]MCO6416501.1 tripartite tricarboxylate transporter substrate binding protein [Siccirubricoccus soli]MCP2682635.1 tripartite tricarboxylate transporter substrate binding protein [Siccirubricoccus soli]